MKYTDILILAVFLLISNTAISKQQQPDEVLKKILIGSWVITPEDSLHRKRGERTTYKADGRLQYTRYDTPDCKVKKFTVNGKWSVKNGRLVATFSPDVETKHGIRQLTTNRIITADKSRMLFRDRRGKLNYRAKQNSCIGQSGKDARGNPKNRQLALQLLRRSGTMQSTYDYLVRQIEKTYAMTAKHIRKKTGTEPPASLKTRYTACYKDTFKPANMEDAYTDVYVDTFTEKELRILLNFSSGKRIQPGDARTFGDSYADIQRRLNEMKTRFTLVMKTRSDQCWKQAILAIQNYLRTTHPSFRDYESLGYAAYKSSNYRKAIEFYTADLKENIRLSGRQHNDVAASHFRLGMAYAKVTDNTKAIQHYERALEIWGRNLGPEHALVEKTHIKLGNLYLRKGLYDKALEHHQKALATTIKTNGPEHSRTARQYGRLGQVYYKKAKYDEAERLYQKSLAIKLKLLKPDSLLLARTYHNFGNLSVKQQHYDKAMRYFQKSLAIKTGRLGATHPSTVGIYIGIGYIHFRRHQYDKALEYFNKSLAIADTNPKTKPTTKAAIYNNFGLVYESKKKFRQAINYYKKSIAIKSKVLAPEHPALAISYNGLGRTYGKIKQTDKAVDYIKMALRIRKKMLGDKHPDTQKSAKILKQIEAGHTDRL